MRVLRAAALAALLPLAACAASGPPPAPSWDPALLRDPSPSVRAAAAGSCPRPIPPAAHDWIEVLLQDDAREVRVAACRLAGDSGDATLVVRLVTIIEDDMEGEVVEAAYRAGCALGQRDPCSRGLITRLVPDAYGPLVTEVNVSPGLEGIEAATGKDIAREMIRYAKEFGEATAGK